MINREEQLPVSATVLQKSCYQFIEGFNKDAWCSDEDPVTRRPAPTVCVQNAELWMQMADDLSDVWIENSCVSERWTLHSRHVIVGVPQNNWNIELLEGQCVDIVPIGETEWAVRPYDFCDDDCVGEGREWRLPTDDGAERECCYPVVDDIGDMGLVLRWMLNEPQQKGGWMVWSEARRMSLQEICREANLQRIVGQQQEFRRFNLAQMASRHKPEGSIYR